MMIHFRAYSKIMIKNTFPPLQQFNSTFLLRKKFLQYKLKIGLCCSS